MISEPDKIKPCPFCGKPPARRRIVEEYDADADGPAGEFDAWHNIECDNCGITVGEEYRSDAIAKWNSRARKVKSHD